VRHSFTDDFARQEALWAVWSALKGPKIRCGTFAGDILFFWPTFICFSNIRFLFKIHVIILPKLCCTLPAATSGGLEAAHSALQSPEALQ
jgi:hypothetical protein